MCKKYPLPGKHQGRFIVFGEVVWDVFPDQKRLGGAPFNFAYYFKRAGGNPVIISAVGNDALGTEALTEIKTAGIATGNVRIDPERETGRVVITLSGNRHRFEIIRNTAWEHIDCPGAIAENGTGLYMGTLARVSIHNKGVCDRLLTACRGKPVCVDLNLRKRLYDKDDIAFLLKQTTHVKANEAEIRILRSLGLIGDAGFETAAEELITRYGLQYCCITLGARGAVGADKRTTVRIKAFPAKKGGDSVGAGDAFTATWLAHLFRGASLSEALTEAAQVGAIVASSKGALAVF
ncbi:MAG: hypothetical protein A2268_15875 [Candidatus Raymondbacteria bacterium RifOxyA12_full_50_37]|uniref:Carbohydrate kinase PfkB domain-containing protein n=1 Tax=Candidatus Raymondbacteria bacterium RIFOXYD12_FULL_49_13 TaxID=1817890 RepID=A0A1F7F5J4_UNCRA|nr:MAG: hypothetical protein A2268_15875 [Candidatus Raymondbacteria bacterium RifOxyA12_full_50_37]OGJ89229.1 MAG: hypothetical protein A2248_18770 [Candidatus Raymondbacteria bacterium RIFOXYA2_FULL_49_16]OGJ96483.1 MAG: hypothetical protein A2487_20540 [Candidatus Raymondbacteria bacterium RifOxyC12_full_50_8]OGJ97395.1 MAG: hypothetical protein A2453_03690 [Candidatus Raymondbacteria bacterium RIFOXYC2_FULL_50_21]OGK01911.1 MAG: hypothetical protein A2519_05570 [Candidatus Raymondbacteria b